MSLGYTKIVAPIDGIVGIASAHVGDLVGPGTGSLTTISQVDPIKATVNVGEQSFNEFLTDHPDADERNNTSKNSDSTYYLGTETSIRIKENFMQRIGTSTQRPARSVAFVSVRSAFAGIFESRVEIKTAPEPRNSQPAYAGTDFTITWDGQIAAVYMFFDKLP